MTLAFYSDLCDWFVPTSYWCPLRQTLTPSLADYETDSIIQTSLRTELGKDVTLLTVAHRLQTIMDADKIVRQTFLPPNHSYLTKLLCRWSSMRAVS